MVIPHATADFFNSEQIEFLEIHDFYYCGPINALLKSF